ncbi:protein THEM6 [Plutella xylostella]|uniref:protein THEM6 n=1 Tax=Plutella xylostella TaxID=51655 RepID=UPI002032CFFC|nr:protein THEM6 [Plutella xylostella]
MIIFTFFVILIILYICFDVNYFVRTYFTVLSGRLYQRKYGVNETTHIYGVCTFQDCDTTLSLRLCRVIRELDFARYHYYDRTGVYRRSRLLGIRSLQGSTLVRVWGRVPLFQPYKITTKLAYWDKRSFFFEHELITLHDGRVRASLVSRQYALSASGDSVEALILGLDGAEVRPECPQYLRCWLDRMELSSKRLRAECDVK